MEKGSLQVWLKLKDVILTQAESRKKIIFFWYQFITRNVDEVMFTIALCLWESIQDHNKRFLGMFFYFLTYEWLSFRRQKWTELNQLSTCRGITDYLDQLHQNKPGITLGIAKANFAKLGITMNDHKRREDVCDRS